MNQTVSDRVMDVVREVLQSHKIKKKTQKHKCPIYHTF